MRFLNNSNEHKYIIKTITSMVFALIICMISLTPTNVIAADDGVLYVTSGDYKIQRFFDEWTLIFTGETVFTGNGCIIDYYGSEEYLTIPKKIAGYTITNIAADAFKNNQSLRTVRVQDTMRCFEEYAFYGCKNLKTVYMSKSVQDIQKYVFAACDSLTDIKVDENNPYFSDINGILMCKYDDPEKGKNLLICCPAGRSGRVVIPDKVRTIEACCFMGCAQLHTISLPESIIRIDNNAFEGCSDLKTINIPSKVTAIPQKAFISCLSLENLKLPDKITEIGESAFEDCVSLKTINIPDGVTTIGKRAFYNNKSLGMLEIPDSVTYIGEDAFMCKDGSVPENLIIMCSSGSAAASYCRNNNINCFLTDGDNGNYERIYGNDRLETACNISKIGWESSDTVILANGFKYPDALAGVPLAYRLDAPILLSGGQTLETAVSEEINRLNAGCVYILGGNTAISYSIENDLRDRGKEFIRLAGSDRFETAAMVADKLMELNEQAPSTVYIASANNFPDALAISTVAALEGNPLLYAPKSGANSYYTEEFIRKSTCSSAVIAGDSGAVSNDCSDGLARLGVYCTRIGGDTRYDTALEICRQYSFLFTSETAFAATGENFPDALAGGVLAAKNSAPLMLVSERSADKAKQYIDRYGKTRIYVLGGKNAVSDITCFKLTKGIERFAGEFTQYE